MGSPRNQTLRWATWTIKQIKTENLLQAKRAIPWPCEPTQLLTLILWWSAKMLDDHTNNRNQKQNSMADQTQSRLRKISKTAKVVKMPNERNEQVKTRWTAIGQKMANQSLKWPLSTNSAKCNQLWATTLKIKTLLVNFKRLALLKTIPRAEAWTNYQSITVSKITRCNSSK